MVIFFCLSVELWCRFVTVTGIHVVCAKSTAQCMLRVENIEFDSCGVGCGVLVMLVESEDLVPIEIAASFFVELCQ